MAAMPFVIGGSKRVPTIRGYCAVNEQRRRRRKSIMARKRRKRIGAKQRKRR